MDNSLTLSNNAIIIIIIVVIVIIAIIILIVVFSNNNNTGGSGGSTGAAFLDSAPPNANVPNTKSSKSQDIQKKLDQIIDNQKNELNLVKNVHEILNSENDSSISESDDENSDDPTEVRVNEHHIKHQNHNKMHITNSDDSTKMKTDDKHKYRQKIHKSESVKSKKNKHHHKNNHKNNREEYHYEEEILDSSEVEKLGIKIPSNDDDSVIQSIDFQHQEFSDTTEIMGSDVSWKPSDIDGLSSGSSNNNNIIGLLTDDVNQKSSVNDSGRKGKSSQQNMMLSSNLSSPDEKTIARVNKKIPLPKEKKIPLPTGKKI